MGITTEKVIFLMAKKAKYRVVARVERIYTLKCKTTGGEVRVFFDESTGILHTSNSDVNWEELFNKSVKQAYNEYFE